MLLVKNKTLEEKLSTASFNTFAKHSHFLCLQCIWSDSLSGKQNNLTSMEGESVKSRFASLLVFVVPDCVVYL